MTCRFQTFRQNKWKGKNESAESTLNLQKNKNAESTLDHGRHRSRAYSIAWIRNTLAQEFQYLQLFCLKLNGENSMAKISFTPLRPCLVFLLIKNAKILLRYFILK